MYMSTIGVQQVELFKGREALVQWDAARVYENNQVRSHNSNEKRSQEQTDNR